MRESKNNNKKITWNHEEKKSPSYSKLITITGVFIIFVGIFIQFIL
jgi:hypothetical protein